MIIFNYYAGPTVLCCTVLSVRNFLRISSIFRLVPAEQAPTTKHNTTNVRNLGKPKRAMPWKRPSLLSYKCNGHMKNKEPLDRRIHGKKIGG